MTKTLEMTFVNQSSKEVILNLRDPKDGLTLAEVTTAANLIVAQNIFTTSGGDLVTFKEARIRIADEQALA
jgi:hypothetical protein